MRVKSTSDAALELLPEPSAEPELKLWLEKFWPAKLIPELEAELESDVTLSVPIPPVPCIEGRRVWPRISRTGRGTVSAKSCTIMRIPNSISRERFNDSSVRSAEMRAARYVP